MCRAGHLAGYEHHLEQQAARVPNLRLVVVPGRAHAITWRRHTPAPGYRAALPISRHGAGASSATSATKALRTALLELASHRRLRAR